MAFQAASIRPPNMATRSAKKPFGVLCTNSWILPPPAVKSTWEPMVMTRVTFSGKTAA